MCVCSLINVKTGRYVRQELRFILVKWSVLHINRKESCSRIDSLVTLFTFDGLERHVNRPRGPERDEKERCESTILKFAPLRAGYTLPRGSSYLLGRDVQNYFTDN